MYMYFYLYSRLNVYVVLDWKFITVGQTEADRSEFSLGTRNNKIVTGLHDSRCTQMCILIFAFRSCYCLGSFILQDLCQVSNYLLSRNKIRKLSVNVFLTCIIFFGAGPGCY